MKQLPFRIIIVVAVTVTVFIQENTDWRCLSTGGWRKLHDDELHSIKSRLRWAGHAACNGGVRSAYKILVAKQMNGTERIQLAQGSVEWPILVNTIMNLRLLKRWGISWLTEQQSISQGLCSVEMIFMIIFKTNWRQTWSSIGRFLSPFIMQSFVRARARAHTHTVSCYNYRDTTHATTC
jgi:hypothetical protein